MENWRFIKENNDYMVSDHGRIMSLKKPQKKILSSSLLHNGYEAIYIYQKGIHAARYVHRLVAETFIPNPKKLPQVNHLDGNTLNNHVSNLEWCDAYDNLMHAIRTGLRPVNVPRSIPCAVTDESGTILHPYPSMRSMVKEEKLNSAQYSWLQLKLTHPERVRLHTMRRWHLPYLPIPPDCTPRPPLRHPAILPAPVRQRGRRAGVQLPERPKGERHSLNYQQFKINKRKEIFRMKGRYYHSLFRHPCGTGHHRRRHRKLASCPRILDDRLPLCHPPRRNNRTRKRRHPRRRTLHGVEQTGNRHLLCRRTGQGRSPRRYTHRRATHRTHPTGEGATACLPRCEAGARTP